MSQRGYDEAIKNMQKFFEKTQSCFDEKDSAYVPKEGMYSVAQQVAHTTHVIDWFIDGAFRPEGLSTDFEAMDRSVRKTTSLIEARKSFSLACDNAIKVLNSKSDAEISQPIGGFIMNGMPRSSIVGGISEHTSHHRGSLAVYARLLGKVPPMPYM